MVNIESTKYSHEIPPHTDTYASTTTSCATEYYGCPYKLPCGYCKLMYAPCIKDFSTREVTITC